jgi:WS/DGAT/MGAT family acyltransferase
MMLNASRRWPQDIGALVILDGATWFDPSGRLRIEVIRQAIGARLHLVPRFRQLIYTPRRGLGGPLWVDDPGFDLREHVREQPLSPAGDETGLLEAIEELRSRPPKSTRPLWEMWLLTGLSDQRVGLYVRIHHSIADGMAAMATVAAFLDTEADAPQAPPVPWTPERRPPNRELAIDNLGRHLRSLARAVSVVFRPRETLRRAIEAWPAMRELLTEQPATETSLNRMVGSGRQVRLIRTSLEAVKQAGRTRNGTVNDVLLTVTAGGVRALLESRGEPIADTTVRAYSPVSLRPREDGVQQGNLIAQMAVPLRLGEPNPSRRMQQVVAETVRRKAMARTSLGVLVHNRILRRFTLMAAMRQRVNVATASIPGPPIPLYLAGARMLEVFPLIPLIADEPVGIGALSYAGNLFIGIVADTDACPDIDVLAVGVRDELQDLQTGDCRSPELIGTAAGVPAAREE